ncbi:MATE family efflux transporter [Eubacteriales bacterium]|nr:MATE family efflux transporter [Faecalicatena sp. BF-R-105]GKH50739.1 MATE family efflux transporter [Eubacteriales bacterium]GKH63461.1 MATE family efflux transporter [Eubacteriales bacterium]
MQQRTHDLTEGPPMARLSRFALPLLLGNLMQQLYNAVDSIIVGRFVGENAFAAIGVAGTVMNIYIFILVGFCTGFSILFASYFGAGDYDRLHSSLVTSCWFGSLLSLAGGLGGILLLRPLLNAIRTPADIADDAALYLRTVLMGLIFTFLYNFLAAALRSIGSSASALFFLLLATIIHILLDILFVAVWGMGVRGVGLATVISQAISVGCCAFYAFRTFPALHVSKKDFYYNRRALLDSANYGAVSALQSSSLYVGKLFIQSAINPLGPVTIAAFSAATRLEDFLLTAGDSGSAALTVFIAQNRGAGLYDRALRGFFSWQRVMIGAGVVLSLLMYVSHPCLLPLIAGNVRPETFVIAGRYLTAMCCFYVLSMVGCCFVGYFRGVGMIRIPFLGTTLQIGIRVLLSFLLTPFLSLCGVAVATGAGWIAIIIFQTAVYRSSFHQINDHPSMEKS